MHRWLLLLFVGMACTTSSVVASQSWRRALPMPEASQEAMTAADVQMFVDEIKKHPDVSVALLDAVRDEVANLMQGQRFSFDFD